MIGSSLVEISFIILLIDLLMSPFTWRMLYFISFIIWKVATWVTWRSWWELPDGNDEPVLHLIFRWFDSLVDNTAATVLDIKINSFVQLNANNSEKHVRNHLASLSKSTVSQAFNWLLVFQGNCSSYNNHNHLFSFPLLRFPLFSVPFAPLSLCELTSEPGPY